MRSIDAVTVELLCNDAVPNDADVDGLAERVESPVPDADADVLDDADTDAVDEIDVDDDKSPVATVAERVVCSDDVCVRVGRDDVEPLDDLDVNELRDVDGVTRDDSVSRAETDAMKMVGVSVFDTERHVDANPVADGEALADAERMLDSLANAEAEDDADADTDAVDDGL